MPGRGEKAFRKLLVWQRAHELTILLYRMTEVFPKHEILGLTSQIRRAAVSIEANIAEGYALGTAPNYLRHLSISVGAPAETECHIEIAHYLEYLADQTYLEFAATAREVGYLLSRLKMAIERNSSHPSETSGSSNTL